MADPSYQPYGGAYSQQRPPQHQAYDQTGHPIPPGFEAPPQAQYSPNAFSPPPRDDGYGDAYGRPPPGRTEYERGYYEGPPSEYGYPGRQPDRQYAPNEPYGHEGNAVTPYDEERAEAEWRDEQARRYAQPPPGPEYFDRDRRRGYPDDRDRRYDSRDRLDDRYSDDSYYESRDRRYEDDRDRRDRDRKKRDRRDSRQEPRSPGQKAKDMFDGREAQVLGASTGGLIGSQLGGGVLETLGGAVVGAVGAKVLEKQKIKRDGKKIADAPRLREEAPSRREAVVGRRDDRRDYDRRDYGGRRDRSRGAREDYSDEYSPSPPRR